MGHYEGKKRGREIGDQKETNSGNNDKKKKNWWKQRVCGLL